MDHTLGRDETLNLLKDAVASQRREQIQKLGETAGKLMLTVDLSRKNIEMLPEEISHVLRRDVERCVQSPLPVPPSRALQVDALGFAKSYTVSFYQTIKSGTYLTALLMVLRSSS